MRAFGLLIMILFAVPAAAEVLTANDARARAGAGELTIVDIRLPVEWAETGLPEGSEGVSLQDGATLQIRPGFVDDVLRAVGGDRDRPIGLICARGNRSAVATALLARAGFTRVHDISEGMIGGENGPGWLARTCRPSPARPADAVALSALRPLPGDADGARPSPPVAAAPVSETIEQASQLIKFLKSDTFRSRGETCRGGAGCKRLAARENRTNPGSRAESTSW